jgi:tetratricopeptide (TPR) repeat protein
MTTDDDVREMIRQTWSAPDGPGQIALAEETLRHAEAAGDPDVAFDARMAATNAFHRGGEPAKAFVTFARCLAEYDADPGRRSAQDEHLLLWYFKYVISSMAKFPEMPLARTDAVLDDMERRYRQGGHSLHAVYAYRHVIATHVGDTEQADHWYRLWDTAPRDENSDCAGCDPTAKVYHLLWRERHADAIAVAEPALAGRLTCSEQPQSILTALMIPYLWTGQLEQARDAHRRAYRAFQANPADLGSVADHVEFCGLTGNEMRGLELIERHLAWLERAPTPKAEMEFASAAGQVLCRLTAAGKGDLTVRAKPGPTTVKALAEELADRAVAIARRFDERNGNTYQSERVTARLAAEPIVAYLPLSITAAYRQRDVPAAETAVGEGRVIDVTEVPESLTLDEQLDRAEEWYQADEEEKAKALGERIVAAHAEADLTAMQRGRVARLRAYRADRRDVFLAEEEFTRAVDAFVEAGDRLHELATRVQLAMARTEQRHDPADAEAGFAAAQELMALSDDPVQRRTTMMRVAYLRALMGDENAALAALDRAAAEPGEALPRRRAQGLMLRAGLLHRQDRIAETVEATREAIELLRPFGASDQLSSALFMYANLVGGLGDHAAALAAFDEAAQVAVDPEVKRSARVNAAFMLVNTDRAGEVIDDIVEHVCLMAAEGEDQAAAYTRHRLAVALATTRRFRESAEVAEEALAWFVAADDEIVMANECRDLLARVYDEVGDPPAALAQLEALMASRNGFDEAGERANLFERMGEVLYRMDRDREAAERYADAAAGYQAAGDRASAARALRRRILALHYGRDPQGAVQAVREVEAVVAGADPAQEPEVVWEHAMACHDGAFVLAEQRDYAAALARSEVASRLFRAIEAFEEAALAELRHGEVQVTSHDLDHGRLTLLRVLEGLPRDHRARSEAAWWLARALDEQGEHGKASKLRKEYDLPEVD